MSRRGPCIVAHGSDACVVCYADREPARRATFAVKRVTKPVACSVQCHGEDYQNLGGAETTSRSAGGAIGTRAAMSEQDLPSGFAPITEEQIRAATIGEPRLHEGRILLVDYDPRWPEQFEREAAAIRVALGERALRLEHVGSTSVPGLAAKPIIDILLVVADSADESSYVPAMEAAGYVLRIREPDWYEHRLFKGPDTDINLHVFSTGCPEIDRVLLLRDWLRENPDDRRLYERTKRELARRDWTYMQHYADAKTAVIDEIIQRARQRPNR